MNRSIFDWIIELSGINICQVSEWLELEGSIKHQLGQFLSNHSILTIIYLFLFTYALLNIILWNSANYAFTVEFLRINFLAGCWNEITLLLLPNLNNCLGLRHIVLWKLNVNNFCMFGIWVTMMIFLFDIHCFHSVIVKDQKEWRCHSYMGGQKAWQKDQRST
jgi:hypothetical protein